MEPGGDVGIVTDTVLEGDMDSDIVRGLTDKVYGEICSVG